MAYLLSISSFDINAKKSYSELPIPILELGDFLFVLGTSDDGASPPTFICAAKISNLPKVRTKPSRAKKVGLMSPGLPDRPADIRISRSCPSDTEQLQTLEAAPISFSS